MVVAWIWGEGGGDKWSGSGSGLVGHLVVVCEGLRGVKGHLKVFGLTTGRAELSLAVY